MQNGTFLFELPRSCSGDALSKISPRSFALNLWFLSYRGGSSQFRLDRIRRQLQALPQSLRRSRGGDAEHRGARGSGYHLHTRLLQLPGLLRCPHHSRDRLLCPPDRHPVSPSLEVGGTARRTRRILRHPHEGRLLHDQQLKTGLQRHDLERDLERVVEKGGLAQSSRGRSALLPHAEPCGIPRKQPPLFTGVL